MNTTTDSTNELACFEGHRTIVLTGGKILVDPASGGQADALAIAGGQVEALSGDARALLDGDHPGVRHLDLAGRAVIPAVAEPRARPSMKTSPCCPRPRGDRSARCGSSCSVSGQTLLRTRKPQSSPG